MKSFDKKWLAAWLAAVLILLSACSEGQAVSDTLQESSSSVQTSSELLEESESDSSTEEETEESSIESSVAESLEESTETEESAVSTAPDSSLPVAGSKEASSQLPAEEVQQVLKDPTYRVLAPVAAGTEVYGNNLVTIDASNSSEGYIMIQYHGSNQRVRVLITPDGGSQYTYTIGNNGRYEVYPLSAGSGGYSIGVYENISGNQYSVACTAYIKASLRSSTLPFLYPNQYVNFWAGCNTVNLGAELSRSAANDLQIVENVYNYVINNITYDFYKANNYGFGYLPSVDNIIATGKGICFDYAAVMAAMLRSQMIPTKLVVGYAGDIYHAWISTYITDVGWVNGIIYFDGQSWVRMDPTFASSGNSSADIMAYIGNGNNYSAMFFY